MPEVELDKFRSSLMKTADQIKGKANEIDIGMQWHHRLSSLRFVLLVSSLCPDPALQSTLGKLAGFRAWFEKRLDDAIQAAEMAEQQQQKNGNGNGGHVASATAAEVSGVTASGGGGDDSSDNNNNKGPSKEESKSFDGSGTSPGVGRSSVGPPGKSTSSPSPRRRSFFNEEPLRKLPDPPFPLSAYRASQPTLAGATAERLESKSQLFAKVLWVI